MTTTHTPGPWQVEEYESARPIPTGRILEIWPHPKTRNGGRIAIMPLWQLAADDPLTRANAALIAAAPELAKALETMLTPLARHPEESAGEYANRLLEVRNAARAALAKAGVK